jgi:hypothetical protein
MDMTPQEAWDRLTRGQREFDAYAAKRRREGRAEFSDLIRDYKNDMHNAACKDDGHYAKKLFTTGLGRDYDIRIFHGR